MFSNHSEVSGGSQGTVKSLKKKKTQLSENSQESKLLPFKGENLHLGDPNPNLPTLNSTYPFRPELLLILCSRRGFGPEEANERQGWQHLREDRQQGAALRAPQHGPASAAAAVGQHQAQREEHQRAQQTLLVGQSDEVPAFLVKIGKSGKAKESPHGSKAPWVAPVDVKILFPFKGENVGFWWSEVLPKMCSQKEHGEQTQNSSKHCQGITVRIGLRKS